MNKVFKVYRTYLTPSSVSTEHYSTASGWLVGCGQQTYIIICYLTNNTTNNSGQHNETKNRNQFKEDISVLPRAATMTSVFTNQGYIAS